MSLRFIALTLVFSGFAVSSAAAAPNHGWYATAEFGADWTGVDGKVTDLPLGGLLGLGHHNLLQLNDQTTTDLDTGWGGFVTVGTLLGPNVQIEGEFGYRTGDASDTETVSQTTLMVNALYSLPIAHKLSLFAGGGIGADLISWDRLDPFTPTNSDDQTLFAYQGIVGLTYDLSDNIALVAKYRYLRTSGADMPGVGSDEAVIHGNDTSSQSVALGLKLSF